MNKKPTTLVNHPVVAAWAATLTACFVLAAAPAGAATVKPKTAAAAPVSSGATPCLTTETAPLVHVTVGKSALLRLKEPVSRILLGNPEGGRAAKPAPVASEKAAAAESQKATAAQGSDGVADVDVILLSPREIYLLGKSVGSTNVILLSKTGVCTLIDIAVGVDTVTLQARLNELLPGNAIKVSGAADSIVLDGSVADGVKAERAVALASAYVGGGQSSRVVNMMSVAAPQQVMLEVKVAEVSKTLAEKLGADVTLRHTTGNWTYSLLSNLLLAPTVAHGSVGATRSGGNNAFDLNAALDNGLIKILAEPTIMAISGQEGSFLAGGRILIPVAQSTAASGLLGGASSTITLEEKEFGVSLKFTPTVLEGGRINLRVRPEVSELASQGASISAVGLVSSILPVINTRKAETTVQLFDGQSFAIGGLIKNNVTQNIKALPILGEIPILGALFRSTDFQTDKTELMFVVTPRLVKPLPPDYMLPTDNYIEPNRPEVFLEGKMEGSRGQAATDRPASAPPAAETRPVTGFEVK